MGETGSHIPASGRRNHFRVCGNDKSKRNTFGEVVFSWKQGNVANELNLIHNPGFERCTNEAPDQWEFHPAASGVKSVMTADKGRCAVLNGQMEQNLHLMQGINITGEEGDIFNLSCWVKALEFQRNIFLYPQR